MGTGPVPGPGPFGRRSPPRAAAAAGEGMSGAGMAQPGQDGHHGLPVSEVVLLLETDRHRGLGEDDAAERLSRFGPNVLPAATRAGPLRRLLSQFRHPLIYVLMAAAVVAFGLDEHIDAALILGVVLINTVVGFVQESKAEAALEGLRSMVRTRARVVRDGRRRTVPSDDLVPGDLVLLEAGDKVPADMRLVRSAELRVDESALTGESAPVAKDEEVLPETVMVADRRNMAYSGTLVTGGAGAGVVTATGADTELGRIHRLVGAATTLDTPLTRKLAEFSRVVMVVVLALAAAAFVTGVLRGRDTVETLTAAVALAVGVIPEGLPATVTIILAIGVVRMARRRAVIRRLPAVETLGGTTAVCSDKTGTLTENQMTVRAIWTPGGEYTLTGSGYAPEGAVHDGAGAPVAVPGPALRACLLAGALCNDSELVRRDGRWTVHGDPTEGAMSVAAAKAGLDPPREAGKRPRVGTIPFDSDRKYMATLHRDPATGGHVVLVKGAVERVTGMCCGELDADGVVRPLDRAAVLAAAEELAGRGLRVLATAVRQIGDPAEFAEEALPGTLVLTGLQAMLDPPRAAAAAAVRSCRTAGISVKMITGDHAVTAAAVAGRIGLLRDPVPSPGEVLTGSDLDALPQDDYPGAVDRARVFARVSAEQKLRLVEALQERGHVVAMTGDGVNDAPALRQADIGVAMGRSGTQVAQDAADMVLTDDDFATIEAAVEEGRGVFDNITKFITWTLPTNVGEGLVVVVAIALGTTLPVSPTQILWINMTTAVALGLMLAFEPKEPGIMNRPPRDPDEPLLSRALVVRILLVSALMLAGVWWLFQWERAQGADVAEARTVVVNLFITVETFYLFSCRSLTRPAWRVGLFANRWILVGVAAQAAAQLAFTYLPAMNLVFGSAPIGGEAWLRILAVATATTLVVAADKRLRRPAPAPASA